VEGIELVLTGKKDGAAGSGGPSSKTRYTADQVDYFVCCALDSRRFWVIPFEEATVITLKIYNGKDSKFHSYEDAWGLLEK
jgi:hypothetical protein